MVVAGLTALFVTPWLALAYFPAHWGTGEVPPPVGGVDRLADPDLRKQRCGGIQPLRGRFRREFGGSGVLARGVGSSLYRVRKWNSNVVECDCFWSGCGHCRIDSRIRLRDVHWCRLRLLVGTVGIRGRHCRNGSPWNLVGARNCCWQARFCGRRRVRARGNHHRHHPCRPSTVGTGFCASRCVRRVRIHGFAYPKHQTSPNTRPSDEAIPPRP